MRKLRLAYKIGLGFSSLILITLLLGGIASWKMNYANNCAKEMAGAYMPSIELSSTIENATLLGMFEMHGYGLTEEQGYYDRGEEHLAKVAAQLAGAHKLSAAWPELSDFDSAVTKADASLAEYQRLIGETQKTGVALAAARGAMDSAGDAYMTNCAAYLENQFKIARTEVRATSGSADREERLGKIAEANELLNSGNLCRLANWRAQAQRDMSAIEAVGGEFDKIDAKTAALLKVTRRQENVDLLNAVRQSAKAYHAALDQLVTASNARNALKGQREVIANTLLTQVREQTGASIAKTTKTASAASDFLSLTTRVLLGGLLAASLLGIVLATLMTRGITKPITRIIEQLSTGARQVAAAAGQVSESSQSLAEGASQQASSLEETSSSLEEMASMTRQNADNTRQANTMVHATNEATEQSRAAMERMRETIGRIKTSSDETARIIKTIDEIAFQTNLLALNAAVEAARAGDAGKGFSVVAEEVRNLARRSAEAARTTAELIEGAKSNAEDGVSVGEEVDLALRRIAESVSGVSGLINDVSVASDEQARGIEQITRAVSEMDKVTQTNAGNAEESASASEELSAQSREMTDVVRELEILTHGQ